MKRKLLEIISADFEATGQILIIYSAFVKLLRKKKQVALIMLIIALQFDVSTSFNM